MGGLSGLPVKERPRLALILLTAISIVGFIDRIIMNVLVEPLKAEFSLTDTQIGIVNGLAFAVLNVGLGLIVARIAERRRRIGLVAIGTLLWSVATAACGLAGNYVQLLFARIGVGVGEAVGLPATHSIVSDYFPREKRATAMSVLTLASPIGAFLGAAGGAAIAQIYGWQMAFFVAAVPGVLLAIAIHLFIAEPPRGRYDGLKGDEAVPPLGTVISRYFKRPTMRHMLFGSTLASMAGFGLNAFFAAYLSRRFGFSLMEAGFTAGLVASVPASISVISSGWLADKLGQGKGRAYALLPAVTLLLAAPLYAFAITRDVPAVVITLVALCALIQYCYLGPTFGTFQNMLHPRMRATGSAFTSMIYTLVGGGIGPLILGGLSDKFSKTAPSPGHALGIAMAVLAGAYVWAAVHYFLAARTIEADLARSLDA